MKRYIDYDEFYDKLVNRLPEGKIWRLKCEEEDTKAIYTLAFIKYEYEAENGRIYPFIVYSYPKTIDAAIIQEDEDNGWDEDISNAWSDLYQLCSLKPFIEA